MDFDRILSSLSASGNLRTLPKVVHSGRYIEKDGRKMLNLSSNDYLGLSSDRTLTEEFFRTLTPETALMSASSSRLLTGNFQVYSQVERKLAQIYGSEDALVFSSGYLMNAGFLPAVADSSTLILADKLVHASIIDGIRLSAAKVTRYRHRDMTQLQRLLEENSGMFSTVIIVTESIFSMDGDVSDLKTLVDFKHRYPGVMLYVDEAHAAGTRGDTGLGVAEEQGCISDIDFLCGTFGKALASAGAYLVCSSTIKQFLVNRMRTLIFNTALPPLNLAWTGFILDRLPDMNSQRKHLQTISKRLAEGLRKAGKDCVSESNIVPVIAGESTRAIELSRKMQEAGFYLLAVRPPTVPEGTSRLRVSLTASVTEQEVDSLLNVLLSDDNNPGI